jgi:hypothetical protein
MTTTTLQFQRLATGLVRATTDEHVYDVFKARGGYGLRISKAAHVGSDATGILTVAGDQIGPTYEADTQALAKGVAAHYEANVDADTKPSQERLTRAIGRAYEED